MNKRKIYSCLLAIGFAILSITAQTPNSISYQAVVRIGDQNTLVTNTQVGVQMSVLLGDENGTTVYMETHAVATNGNGLLSLAIGQGAVQLGSFELIDWANGPYFIKTEIDPQGGSNYSMSSTTQLLTVPYALHAKSAETISGKISYDKISDAPSGNYNDLLNKPDLFSGDYADLINPPSLAKVSKTGSYNDLIDRPQVDQNAFSGNYVDLSGKPNIQDSINTFGFSGEYADLQNKPVNFSGNYTDLTNQPLLATVASSGSYSDLSDRPVIGDNGFTGSYSDLSGKPNILDSIKTFGFSGDYSQLVNKPILFTGSYNDLTDIPTSFTGSYNDLNDQPNLSDTIAKYGFDSDYNSLLNTPDLEDSIAKYAFDGDYANLAGKPNIRDSVASYISDVEEVPEGSSSGDILYWNDEKWKLLQIGLDGHVLTSVKGQLVWKEPVISSTSRSEIYENGDVYLEGGKPVGVVIESSTVGQYAKVISLEEFEAVWDTSSYITATNARNANNGILNMNIIKNIPNSIASYAAFDSSLTLGNEWYLPSLNEFLLIVKNKNDIEAKLASISGASALQGTIYWTSTEAKQTLVYGAVLTDTTMAMNDDFFSKFELDYSHLYNEEGIIEDTLYFVNRDTTLIAGSFFQIRKQQRLKVRPIRYLSWAEMNSKPISQIKYAIGDVYPTADNPEGVVFDIWNGGLNGKIISLTQDSLAWSVENVLLDATSLSDGSINGKIIKQYDITLTSYPSTFWCLEKGQKWYLPARSELVNLYAQLDSINSGLNSVADAVQMRKASGAEDLFYWSSSEIDASKSFSVNFRSTGVVTAEQAKATKSLVRAIRTF